MKAAALTSRAVEHPARSVPESTLPLADLDRAQLDYDALSRDSDRAEALRTELVLRAYRWHREHNPGYDAYARACGVGDDTENLPWDRVPLLPSGLFKQPRLNLASVPAADIAKWCVSSGTSGSRSAVPRDEPTLERFLGSITASIPALYGLERAGGHRGLVLGPSPHEAGDLWLSYVIGCLSLIMQTEIFERDGIFDADGAARRLLELSGTGSDTLLIGPPARLLAVARACEALAGPRGVPPLSARSFLVTAGGWKDEQARSMDAETFRATVATALNAADPGQIRDSYAMVELNSVLHECVHHYKHVPPWIGVRARDPHTDAALASGIAGILAFWDPTATSYPGFLLSEDVGSVLDGPCPCGYSTPRVRVVRRVATLENRGCALRMSAGQYGDDVDDGRDRFFRRPFPERAW